MKEVNYNIIQGDSFQLALTYTDPLNAPINLSGCSALMEIKDQPGGRLLCASATYTPATASTSAISDGITITSASGLININLSPAKTRKFNFPKSAYQLQITDASGTKVTLLTGWFNVNAGVID